MESPGGFPESPMEQEDVVYTCKGCGEILEEGKAFELAGNRWHIDCFRCNTCCTLLDSDANLLLLGDGSLICNNCTYSCNACGNKIEDLAILTGDQAFCASCFRCRNCKRKIDNLRYARTSQGIFCMSCHESLMARRRKKSRAAAAQQKLGSNGQSPMLLDKSLPSLPPSAVPPIVSSPDRETPTSDTYTDTPTELSPRPRPPHSRQTSPRPRPSNSRHGSSQSRKRERSPLAFEDAKQGLTHQRIPEDTPLIGPASLNLPFASEHEPRRSLSQRSELSGNGSESLNIPFLLDDGNGPDHDESPASHHQARDVSAPEGDRVQAKPSDARTVERDYFNTQRAPTTNGHPPGRHQTSSPGSARDQESRHASSKGSTPHIAFQERGRQRSEELTDVIRHKGSHQVPPPPPRRSRSITKDPTPQSHGDDARVQHANPSKPTRNGKLSSGPGENFKLQEVPKNKRTGGSTRSSRSETQVPLVDKPAPLGLSRSVSTSEAAPPPTQEAQVAVPRSDSTRSLDPIRSGESPPVSSDARHRDDNSVSSAHSASSFLAAHLLKKAKREESSSYSRNKPHATARKEPSGGSISKSPPGSPRSGEFLPSASSGAATQGSPVDSTSMNGSLVMSMGAEPSVLSGNEPSPTVQTRSAYNKAPIVDSFTSPRAPPQPPVTHPQSPVHASHATASESTLNGDADPSPGLPRHSAGGEFSLEDDMARILGGNDERSTSLLRRVSNAVRHGRSFSDMETRTRGSSGKWPRSPGSTGLNSPYPREISSPTTTSPVAVEENAALKHELRRSAQKIAELEARVLSSADIKTLDTKLREKRSTVAFLDTQKEIMVRELEVLTEHVADVKKTEQPFDVDSLTSKVVREFALSLQRLRDTYSPEIEELIHQKNTLVEENSNLAHLRDQAIQETEQLNLKNAQLADLNNELTHQIQERYKANREQGGAFEPARPATNGLGIYTNHQKERSDVSMDVREPPRPGTSHDLSNVATQSTLVEQNEAEPATVLTAPHVVNIRKGQVKKFNWKKGGQSVAKGVSKGLKGAFSSTAPYQYQYQRESPSGEIPTYGPLPVESPNGSLPRMPSDPNNKQALGFFGQRLGKSMPPKMQSNGNVIMAAEGPNVLFGSDLGERADYERRQIPSVVTRCIEEVELRGMDVEGIYRKTGGNSQVKAIQEGFERTNDYDISDPGLDITAVTSVLKQYFRKLPNPLMTYDAYERMLETNNIMDEEKRIIAMRITIQALPPKHHDCLEFLIFHLGRVAGREKENLMTPKNLAVVFAPTIMRDTSLEREMSDMFSKNSAIQFMIENYKMVFPGA
ncbi:MAG: Rho-type gtpase-activating protein [Sclerophora amabilis]|nr:MAG: Rho-type gtpase-activating protein [Sclerophora amabilis]